MEEHNQRFKKALHKVPGAGLKLSQYKCKFRMKEIIYIGEKLCIQSETSKIKAITIMIVPTDRGRFRGSAVVWLHPTF